MIEDAMRLSSASDAFCVQKPTTPLRLRMVFSQSLIRLTNTSSSSAFLTSAAQRQAGPVGSETAYSPLTMVSRPSLLADQLRRFDGVLESRGRTSRAGDGGGAAFTGGDRVLLAGPSGDPYRRAALARDNLGRRGAFR
jgi:hypothetical protein